MKNIYQDLLSAKKAGKKKIAILLDPDKLKLKHIETVIEKSMSNGIDYFFIGGSLIINDMLDQLLLSIRQRCDIPIILFPGNSFQLSYKADALLLLSLISGRNPELLIGKHVMVAPYLKISPLEIIPTGYILVDGGKVSSVQYISNTAPIPGDKNDIAACTALAGEMLGLKLIYLDAGSGAQNPVTEQMISTVRSQIDVPLIVGGGIDNAERISVNFRAGADLLVIGNAIEKRPDFLDEIGKIAR